MWLSQDDPAYIKFLRYAQPKRLRRRAQLLVLADHHMQIDIWCAEEARQNRLRELAPPDRVTRMHSTLGSLRTQLDSTYQGVVIFDLSSRTEEKIVQFITHLADQYPQLFIVGYYDTDITVAGGQGIPTIITDVVAAAQPGRVHIIVNDIREESKRLRRSIVAFCEGYPFKTDWSSLEFVPKPDSV